MELPLEKQPTPKRNRPGIELLDKPTDARYWLTTEDGTRLIQVQPDYLGLNWRRRNPEQSYIGYTRLREEFTSRYAEINKSLHARFNEKIEPNQAEITYVNIIRPNPLWTRHGDALKIFQLDFGDSEEFEQIVFGYSRALESDTGEFAGRVHVSLQSAVDAVRQMPVMNLTITARSAAFHEPAIDQALIFFDIAHEAARGAFRRITTDPAREMWGLS